MANDIFDRGKETNKGFELDKGISKEVSIFLADYGCVNIKKYSLSNVGKIQSGKNESHAIKPTL